jgi:hypothetical protein
MTLAMKYLKGCQSLFNEGDGITYLKSIFELLFKPSLFVPSFSI